MAQSKSNKKISSEFQLMQSLYKYLKDNNVLTTDDVFKIAKDNNDDIRSIIAKNSYYVNKLKKTIKDDYIDGNQLDGTRKTSRFRTNEQPNTKEEWQNMFLLIKVIHFLNKHEKCKFEEKDGFWSVSDKDNKDNTKDFYFYSFGKNIEYFVDDKSLQKICVKKRAEDKRQSNVTTGLMSVSSLCVNKDNNILTTHYRSDEPQCYNIGCNFIIDKNKAISHDNFAFATNGEGRICDIQNVFRFRNTRQRNPNHLIGHFGNPSSVTENLSLGRRCGVSDIETILSIRFHKQNHRAQRYLHKEPTISKDIDKRQMKNYDETILDTPVRKDEYKIHDFCFSFEPDLFNNLKEDKKLETKKLMEEQIEKVVKANEKLGVKQINIIDYENKPSFIKIPNDIKCVQEYLDTRIQGKNFDNERIEQMNNERIEQMNNERIEQMNNDKEIVLLKDKLEYQSDKVENEKNQSDKVENEKNNEIAFVPQKKQKSCLTPWEELSTGGKVWRSIWTLGFGTPLFNCCSCNASVMTKD